MNDDNFIVFSPIQLIICMTLDIPEEQWKILDKTYFVIGKTLNIVSTESTEEVFINNSTNIAFIGKRDQSTIVIEVEDKKYVIKGQTEYIFSLFFTLAGCKYSTYSQNDLQILEVLDKNHFGKIIKAQLLFDNQIYILKTIRKKKLNIISEQTLQYESYLTTLPNHPFIINLCFTIHNEPKYFLGYEYPKGGKLLFRLEKLGQPKLDYIRLYAAELTLALEHLSKYVKHPNLLKPDNVLLDSNGHIKLVIYTEPNEFSDNLTLDFPEFTPEYIDKQQTDYKSLIWFLGCFLYNMVYFSHPFEDKTQAKTFDNILHKELTFPKPAEKQITDLIQKLLRKNPEERLTFDQIKIDPFFENLDWNKVYHKQIIERLNLMAISKDDDGNSDKETTPHMAEFENFSCDFTNNIK